MSAGDAAGSMPTPVTEQAIPATPVAELDAAVDHLADRAPTWAGLGVEARLALLDELVETTTAAASAWADRAAVAKGHRPDGPVGGEELLNGPVQVVRNLVFLRRTLQRVRDGDPVVELDTAPSGRVMARTFPVTLVDRLLFRGFDAVTWLHPDVSLEEARQGVARNYRRVGGAIDRGAVDGGRDPDGGRTLDDGGRDRGGVAVVLGAGNVSSIGPMDALSQLFAHDRVVLLKMNPVNDYLGPFLAEALHPLIRDGYVRIAYGGADEGSHLVTHEKVDAIHLTGSDATHDAIVFGTGSDGARRKAEGEPRVAAEVTSELGNVTPVIVVPGPWSEADLAYHGESIASMLTNNAGFNCIATRVIVQHAAWARRHDLLDQVRVALDRAPQRVAYYPGARRRWERFLDAHDRSECFGQRDGATLPFALLADVDEAAADHIAFTTEAFAPVMAEVGLDAPRSVAAYLRRAVEFVNDTLWGNLAATILIHPRSLRDPQVAEAFDWALEHLRYGTVVVNHWSGAAGYALVSTPWGAHPGNEITDIQSGRGWVHNTSLLADEHLHKTIVRGPFRTDLTPPWFVSAGNLRRLGERVIGLEATGDLRLLPGVVWAALRG